MYECVLQCLLSPLGITQHILLPTSKCTKVESGLLQIDPAHRWNFSTFFEKIKIKSERWHTIRKWMSEKGIQNILGKV